MPLCNQLLLCSYGNFPSLAHPLLSPQLFLFGFHPKLSMAYSEGDGLRSVGQLDSKQKGSFVESPFPGFPICLIDEVAKGLDGFASAALASAGLGKGPCPPFRLMDWKGSRWSHICPQPWHLLWLGCQQMLGSHLLHPARCGGKILEASPRTCSMYCGCAPFCSCPIPSVLPGQTWVFSCCVLGLIGDREG